ncbi:DTW domain-containing protein 1 [Dissophora globulifera]|uniref:tRNA-uridine aminocarboxypropyltransferase 1 n=1 Tax=Dissophora globulifera TaxID=979702 RepID=A0A9P6RN68_9FUNG|nr:DTW domain-containing protein 1 [Dissophora globulifera]
MATQGQQWDQEQDDGSNKRHTSSFSQFDISSTDVLNTVEKMHCPSCNKNVRYYCAKCLKLVNCPEGSVPQLKLPIKIDIIKHEQERDGKSTALHAKLLAPVDVEVYGWKDMPAYENVDRLLLLFPSPGAKRLSEIDPLTFDKLVVIDGTWDQAKKMSSDSSLLRMKRVTIAPHETLFWRHQRKTDDHLATIEAIYYFLREYHETYLSSVPCQPPATSAEGSTLVTTLPVEQEGDQHTSEASQTINLSERSKIISPHKEWIDSQKLGPYTNQFDDMLWFYKYFYELIQKTYRERKDGREFTMRHKKGYIHYHTDEEQGKEGKKGKEGKEGNVIDRKSRTSASTATSTSATAPATGLTAEPSTRSAALSSPAVAATSIAGSTAAGSAASAASSLTEENK